MRLLFFLGGGGGGGGVERSDHGSVCLHISIPIDRIIIINISTGELHVSCTHLYTNKSCFLSEITKPIPSLFSFKIFSSCYNNRNP